MTKSKIAFVFFIVGISSAQAATTKVFHSMDGADRGCKLAKFSGGKWLQSDEKDVNGQNVTNITPSKANADFANFKFQNTWYASRSECLKDSDSGGSSEASTPNGPSKYFAEVKLQKYLVLSAINPTGTTGGVTYTATTNYTTGFGFDGRLGYHWKDTQYFILDVSSLPASQTITYTSPFSGQEIVSDSILLINVGYMMTFEKPLLGMKPYVAGLIGYAKLSGSTTQVVTYSASGIDLGVEGGLVKDFTPHWSALGSLGLTYLSLNPTVVTPTTDAAMTYPVGTALGSRSYTHFTLAIGARYNF